MPTKAQVIEIEKFKKSMRWLRGEERTKAEATLYRMRHLAGMPQEKKETKEK